MKKLLSYLITMTLLLTCLTGCVKYEKNKWFSTAQLSKCLVPDMPKADCPYVNEDDYDIYAQFTDESFNSYVIKLYEYLLSMNFEYFGTRGDLLGSLNGAFGVYYFQPTESFEEFLNDDGFYRFVYSDGKIVNGNDEMTFCIIRIEKFDENKILKYSRREFEYNTIISLRFNSEAPLGGRYILEGETS